VEGPIKLALRVSPGATRAGIVGRQGTAWKVRVAEPPEGGRANDAVVRLLAETLRVSRRDVEIVSGHGARDKIVALTGVDRDEIERRLASVTGRQGKERE
jgi:uncharacterized protein (TIGR00251 family)